MKSLLIILLMQFVICSISLAQIESEYEWQPIESSSIGNPTLHTIQVVNPDFICAGGDGGIFVKTNDGGDTWTSEDITIYDITSIFFVNEFKGWIGLDVANKLLKTDDGGNTWSEVEIGESSIGDIIKIIFFDENNGIALRSINGIYKTDDGGSTWEFIEIPDLAGQIADMDALSQEHIIILSDRGYYYKSNDFGQAWEEHDARSQLSNADFSEIEIVNNNVIYLLSDSYIARTSDGGLTWVKVKDIPSGYNNLIMFDEMKGKINTGGLFTYNTEDGFENFSTYDKNFGGSINQMDFYDETTGWAAITPESFSDYGPIAKYVKTKPTYVDENSELPTSFALNQNYPNPFNPSTTISYSIPKQSNVSIKVFDVLGTEVAELVNEQKSPGNYKVTFNAARLSSGIYFYTLQTKQVNQTRKMILIK